MGAIILVGIMGYQGQVIKGIRVDEAEGKGGHHLQSRSTPEAG
ncbi:MAG TPA: hypothetical protein PKC22_07465 [Rhodocyclaceae bacterium]|nr:hypothetical protein [Rhodocyclaceae bacterium]